MFASKEEVARLRARALAWRDEHYAGADPLIPQVMNMMLKFEHIAPVWSCEGHFKDGSGKHPTHQNFYMMFAIEEKAWPIMKEIYMRLQARLMVHQRRADGIHDEIERDKKVRNAPPDEPVPVGVIPRYSAINHLTMSFSNRQWPERPPQGEIAPWYNVLILNGQTYRKSAKSVFFRELVNTLVEIGAEQQR